MELINVINDLRRRATQLRTLQYRTLTDKQRAEYAAEVLASIADEYEKKGI